MVFSTAGKIFNGFTKDPAVQGSTTLTGRSDQADCKTGFKGKRYQRRFPIS